MQVRDGQASRLGSPGTTSHAAPHSLSRTPRHAEESQKGTSASEGEKAERVKREGRIKAKDRKKGDKESGGVEFQTSGVLRREKRRANRGEDREDGEEKQGREKGETKLRRRHKEEKQPDVVLQTSEVLRKREKRRDQLEDEGEMGRKERVDEGREDTLKRRKGGQNVEISQLPQVIRKKEKRREKQQSMENSQELEGLKKLHNEPVVDEGEWILIKTMNTTNNKDDASNRSTTRIIQTPERNQTTETGKNNNPQFQTLEITNITDSSIGLRMEAGSKGVNTHPSSAIPFSSESEKQQLQSSEVIMSDSENQSISERSLAKPKGRETERQSQRKYINPLLMNRLRSQGDAEWSPRSETTIQAQQLRSTGIKSWTKSSSNVLGLRRKRNFLDTATKLEKGPLTRFPLDSSTFLSDCVDKDESQSKYGFTMCSKSEGNLSLNTNISYGLLPSKTDEGKLTTVGYSDWEADNSKRNKEPYMKDQHNRLTKMNSYIAYEKTEVRSEEPTTNSPQVKKNKIERKTNTPNNPKPNPLRLAVQTLPKRRTKRSKEKPPRVRLRKRRSSKNTRLLNTALSTSQREITRFNQEKTHFLNTHSQNLRDNETAGGGGGSGGGGGGGSCGDVFGGELLDYNVSRVDSSGRGWTRGGRVHLVETVVTLLVKDINDNPPVFPNTTMFGEVQENGPIGEYSFLRVTSLNDIALSFTQFSYIYHFFSLPLIYFLSFLRITSPKPPHRSIISILTL